MDVEHIQLAIINPDSIDLTEGNPTSYLTQEPLLQLYRETILPKIPNPYMEFPFRLYVSLLNMGDEYRGRLSIIHTNSLIASQEAFIQINTQITPYPIPEDRLLIVYSKIWRENIVLYHEWSHLADRLITDVTSEPQAESFAEAMINEVISGKRQPAIAVNFTGEIKRPKFLPKILHFFYGVMYLNLTPGVK